MAHLIVKYLEEQFNPKNGCTSFKLGTLKHYRESPEEDGIGDFLEGAIGFSMKEGESLKLTPETAGNFFPGLKAGVITVGPASHSGVAMLAMIPNCYLYCMTIFENEAPNQNLFPQYNSHFVISDVNQLAVKLTDLVAETFTLDQLDEFSLDRLKKIPAKDAGIEFMFIRSKVDYGQEKLKQVSNSNAADLNQLPGTDLAQLFCKPEQYSWQQEFRIAIRPMNKRIGFLSVKKEPLVVDANRIGTFMEFLS